MSLIAVGDIMLGDSPITIGHGVASRMRKTRPDFIFQDVASALNQGDVVFGNLEAVLSDTGENKKLLSSVQLRAAPASVEALKRSGFNVLSLANNHILEHGKKPALDTLDILARNDILCVGLDAEFSGISKLVTKSVNGLKIGFLAYCLVPDKTAYRTATDTDEIVTEVKKAKNQCDILVVSMHWGREYINKPSPEQVRTAHRIIDAGAGIILGHHAHVLQGIEEYNSGLIAYSLGNFVFDMWQDITRKTMILQIEVTSSGVSGYKIIPVMITEDFQPEILSGSKEQQMTEYIAQLSAMITKNMDADEYEREAARIHTAYRKDVRLFFLKNFLRYNPRYSFQILKTYIGKVLG